MTGDKIKVLIVDDSIFFRTALQTALGNAPNISVVGLASNADDAEKKISRLQPDVITLDIEMPGMSGIEFLKKLIPVNPIPVILVSSSSPRIFDILEAGAVDFVKKPDVKIKNAFDVFSAELYSKIKVAAHAKVKKAIKPTNNFTTTKPSILKISEIASRPFVNTVIAIGASTGGTEAILQVVRQLPENTPPVVITQHMPPGFTKMYADRLNKICKMEVWEAKNGDRLRQGLALLAPGDKQMTVEKDQKGYFVRCVEGEKVSGHCPSVDVLFDSVSKTIKNKAIGIILTGMGKDGAQGLLNMKKSGAYTIGQDEETCVVYGMPMVAFNIGAVIKQAPCPSIAGMIINLINKKSD